MIVGFILVLFILLFLQNLVHYISVAHGLKPTRRVGKESVGARVVEAVEGYRFLYFLPKRSEWVPVLSISSSNSLPICFQISNQFG